MRATGKITLGSKHRPEPLASVLPLLLPPTRSKWQNKWENKSYIKNKFSFSQRWCQRQRRKPLPLPKPKPEQRLWRPRQQCWKASAATKTVAKVHKKGGRKHCSSGGGLKTLGRQPLEEMNSTSMTSSKSPSVWVGQEENRRPHTLVLIVAVKANKHQIKQAGKKLYDVDVAKVNTLIRPDAENKAGFWLGCFWLLPTELGSSKSHCRWWLQPWNEKTLTPWEENYDQPRLHIKKQRHYFANKGPSSQGFGFSSGHVWMWELDCKESWALKNWYFWTVVL